ncbi:MAG: FGGY-family carbohydrate kinase, partial [Bacilli bacterium]
ERTPVVQDAGFGECHTAETLWFTTAAVIRACIERAQTATQGHARITALAVASCAEEGVCLDSSLHPVAPVIPWYDARTEAQAGMVAERFDPDQLRRLTGMPLDRSFSLCKLLWMREHLPAAWARTVHFVPIADYINLRLTGQLAVSPSLASRTLLYSPFRNVWLEEVKREFDLARIELPALVAGGEPVGRVTAEAALATGLTAGAIVGMGGHDDACAAVGAGVLQPGTGLLSSGTAEALYVLAPAEQLESSSPSLCIGRDATGRHLYLSDFVPAGALIHWTMEHTRVASAGDRGVVDAAIGQAAANSLANSSTVRFEFTRNPISLSSFSWSGLTLESTPSDMLGAVLVSANEQLRLILAEITRLTGQPLQTLVACGGLSAIPGYVALKETQLGQSIAVHPYTELTAGGAAVLAAQAVRQFDSCAAGSSILLSQHREEI